MTTKIFSVAILLYGISVYAARPNVFVMGDVTYSDKNTPIGKQYGKTISNAIPKEKGFSINEKSASYRVSGSIVKMVLQNDKGVTKYINEVDEKNKYQVVINVVDLSSGKIDSSYRDIFYGEKGADRSASLIASQIIERYRISVHITEKNEMIKPAEKVKPSDNNPAIADSSQQSRIGLEIMPSASAGFGSYYSNFRKVGYGFILSLPWESSMVTIKPSFGFSYNIPGNSSINSSYSFNGMANIGYSLSLSEKYRLTPFIGGGIIYSRVSGEIDSSKNTRTYTNPQASGSIELEYILTRSFSIVFSPSYCVIFEKSRNDQYIEAGFGVRFFQ